MYVSVKFGFGELKKTSFRKIKKNTTVIITLPTPKQESVAKEIYYQNPKLRILCLGGALNIASGHELPVPKFLEKIGLEFFWRLKTDPLRRSVRLIKSFSARSQDVFCNLPFSLIYGVSSLCFKRPSHAYLVLSDIHSSLIS